MFIIKTRKNFQTKHHKLAHTNNNHILERQLKWFKGTVLEHPNSDYGIQTTEGVSAYKETIDF